MVVALIILAVLTIGGLMLYALSRLAANRGESPGSWTLGMALVWGFIWMVLKASAVILGPEESLLYQRWYSWFLAASILLCFTTFALYWYLLDNRADEREMEEKVEEIGE